MQNLELRGKAGLTVTQKQANLRILLLFGLVVVGILANWFWGIGWQYLADPQKGFPLGSAPVIVIRVALSLIAAALTFVPVYKKINQNTSESWVPYLLAFQNGFFWQAALEAITKQF